MQQHHLRAVAILLAFVVAVLFLSVAVLTNTKRSNSIKQISEKVPFPLEVAIFPAKAKLLAIEDSRQKLGSAYPAPIGVRQSWFVTLGTDNISFNDFVQELETNLKQHGFQQVKNKTANKYIRDTLIVTISPYRRNTKLTILVSMLSPDSNYLSEVAPLRRPIAE